MGGMLVPSSHQCSIRQEGLDVIILMDGNLIMRVPWQQALEVANGIRYQAKKAEELANVDKIIEDSALLIRTGSPFGLTTRSDIMKEAAKEAVWNTDLRRYIPRSKAERFGHVYAPSVRRIRKK